MSITTQAVRELFVSGGWQPASSGETYVKYDPMHPTTAVAEVAAAGEADAEAAVAAAGDAQPAWARLPLARRGSYLTAAASALELEARAERVARDMTAEMGKPLRRVPDGSRPRRADPALRGKPGLHAHR
jgi:acyl-CoA reductase-like NAD-dependent aldehyde dehydrogenase